MLLRNYENKVDKFSGMSFLNKCSEKTIIPSGLQPGAERGRDFAFYNYFLLFLSRLSSARVSLVMFLASVQEFHLFIFLKIYS